MRQLDPTEARPPIGFPEKSLIAAIVMQSIYDLKSPEDDACKEAHLFWTSKSGEWAESRSFYLTLLGLNEAVAARAIRKYLPTPERVKELQDVVPQHNFETVPYRVGGRIVRRRKPAFLELYDKLPDGEFTIEMIVDLVDVRYQQVSNSLHSLRQRGLVRRVRRIGGKVLFARTDWLIDEVTPQEVA